MEFGGRIDALKYEVRDESAAEDAYLGLRDLAGQAHRAGATAGASRIEEILASIDQLAVEFIDELHARTEEFGAYVEARRIRPLDPWIDAQKLLEWIDEELACRTEIPSSVLPPAGRQPQHSGEAATGGATVHPPFVPDPEDMLDPNRLAVSSTWAQDAFGAEVALIAGRLPPGFEFHPFDQRWHFLCLDSEIRGLCETLHQWGPPTPQTIDSMIERLRAVEGGRGHIQLIRQLEALKEGIDQALTNAYGFRADADWLAKVDEFLKSGSAAPAVGGGSVSVASRGEDIVEGARTSLQPARVESAAAPGSTEAGAGELSPGALSPAQDPWGPSSPLVRIGQPQVRYGESWPEDYFAGERALIAGDLAPGTERVLRAAHPGRVDPGWLDPVRDVLRGRGELAPPNAASTTGLPEFNITAVDQTGAGAGAPPPAAGPWSVRPPGVGGGPHPVAFDPWSAPPGPSSRVVHTETIRTPMLSPGAPPGWPGAEAPGFARAASGADQLLFLHRQRIAYQFGTNDALIAAEYAIVTGRVDALGLSPARWQEVLNDLYWLNAVVELKSAAAAARGDIDRPAIEALVRILDAPLFHRDAGERPSVREPPAR